MQARTIFVVQAIAIVDGYQVDLTALGQINGFVENQPTTPHAGFQRQRHQTILAPACRVEISLRPVTETGDGSKYRIIAAFGAEERSGDVPRGYGDGSTLGDSAGTTTPSL